VTRHRADETLADIRDLADELAEYVNANKSSPMPYSALALAKSVQELDSWLMRGGALPADWQNDNDADES
jgi:hypothetical protein